MPECMKEYWDDPAVVYDFCHQMTNPPSEDGSDT